MSGHPTSPEIINQSEQFEHGVDADIVDNEALGPQYIEDDPEFKQMLQEEKLKYKDIWYTPEWDVVELGDPNNSAKKPLKEVIADKFREKNPDKFLEYRNNENRRQYDKITNDPAYRKMREMATVNTNSDNPRSTESWNRSNSREMFFGRQNFAAQYKEKAQLYANDFEYYTEHHPEIKQFTDVYQWDQWCEEHPDARDLNESRYMSLALRAVESRKKANRATTEATTSTNELTTFRAAKEDQGLLDPTSDHLGDISGTSVEKTREQSTELIYQQMIDSVQSVLPENLQNADDEILRTAQSDLKDIPYMHSDNSRDLTDAMGMDEGTLLVETDKIVGSVSPAFENWSSEYAGRKDLVINIAKKLMRPTEESLENVFHLKEPEKGGVKLKKISAPEGDLFFVIDGTHRVAGSKLAQTPELPAQVEKMADVSEVKCKDKQVKYGWENLIKIGLIKGEIHESIDNDGNKEYSLKIEKQVLPWLHLPQPKMLKMNTVYKDKYPKAFENLKTIDGKHIPVEALTDEIAFNAFSSGRWNEYEGRTNKTETQAAA